MHQEAIQRAEARLAAAADPNRDPALVDGALERARSQIESLAETVADFQAALPERVGDAVKEGLRTEALPVARQLAEVRGLTAHLIRRFERLEGEFAAERHARVDDLALLVDLVSSGWKAIDERLSRLEATFGTAENAIVLRSTNGR